MNAHLSEETFDRFESDFDAIFNAAPVDDDDQPLLTDNDCRCLEPDSD